MNFNNPINFPDFQLASEVKEAPTSAAGMIWEQKLDGVRAMVSSSAVRLRNIHLPKHALLMPDKKPVPRGCLLDGEIISLDGDDVATAGRVSRGQWKRLEFVPFDCLYWDGKSLRSTPYLERRHRLLKISPIPKQLVPEDETGKLPTIPIDWEGVVGKPIQMPYQAGHHKDGWVKWKQVGMIKCLCLGFAEGQGSMAGTVGAVIFGLRMDGKDLEFGRAGGLTFKDRWEFMHRPEEYIGRPILIKHYGMVKTRFRNPTFEGFADG